MSDEPKTIPEIDSTDQRGSAKAAGAPGAESTATPTNSLPQFDGAMVERGVGWVKVHRLSSEAADALVAALNGRTAVVPGNADGMEAAARICDQQAAWWDVETQSPMRTDAGKASAVSCWAAAQNCAAAIRAAIPEFSQGPTPNEAQDALRWRWWLANGMYVARDRLGDWTCWLMLPTVPFRSRTTDPNELTDALLARFPLDGGRSPAQVRVEEPKT